MKKAFIAWIRFHQRTELLAQHFGATAHYFYYGQKNKLVQLPVRYLVQGWRTWRVLCRDRPDLIFVQNPPIFCALVAFLYAQMHEAQYVIDSHTGAFLSLKWRWSLWLHRLLSRFALTTIVHNKSQEKIVTRWGCHTFVLGDYPGPRPAGKHFPLDEQFNVAIVSSFAADEPLDLVFEAARRLPEVSFYVTGDPKLTTSRFLGRRPNNCRLTGYLPYERYVGLLRGVHAIMVLTTRDHTLLSGAFEAVSLGTPLITSDWPILRDYFCLGTVHIPNTVEGICKGVRRAQFEHNTLRRDILRLRARLQKEWEQKFEELQHYIIITPVGGAGGSGSSPNS